MPEVDRTMTNRSMTQPHTLSTRAPEEGQKDLT